ncbi:MAG: hypothetical protein PF689_14480 [Deltaproteobacteria bacterium]|jgi:hypothetical protein|nr:hypothetical protein [Deltaproteobacteria bacterium]
MSINDGVASGVSNWRIWGMGSLNVAPVFTAPLTDGQTLVCYTVNSTQKVPKVARIDAQDQLVEIYSLTAGLECRGLAAESDGHFGTLLWSNSEDRIFVNRYDSTGNELWSTELTNVDNKPDDFTIGDSRLEFGNSTYGAYYHVHSDSGHEGDTLKWVNTDGNESTGWSGDVPTA